MTPTEAKEARTALGLSQTQLAEVMGLRGKQTVSEWERGARQPDGQSVRLIQAYLAGYRPADWPTQGTARRTVRQIAEYAIGKWEDAIECEYMGTSQFEIMMCGPQELREELNRERG